MMPGASAAMPEDAILLRPDEGRHYECGPMHAIFLADGAESGDRYCVSIWRVDAGKPGPGAHSHEANEELFYVIEGTMTFQVGEQMVDAATGTFLRVPAGVMHDFLNRTKEPAAVLNVFIPGGFEVHMPSIVEWFRLNPQT
jgi:mannose-6-phosphate isomerase-like protein (cupin superfamily)